MDNKKAINWCLNGANDINDISVNVSSALYTGFKGVEWLNTLLTEEYKQQWKW